MNNEELSAQTQYTCGRSGDGRCHCCERYLRQTDNVKMKKLIGENEEMFFEDFKERQSQAQ
ncbi:MAG: hypothetical protein ACI391_07800 [Muribaculaceae bacterium]